MGILCLTLVATGAPVSSEEATTDPSEGDDRSAHVERPHDAYLPTPPQPPGPRRKQVVSRDGFVSVQVNTDASGNNIIGDAANEPSIAVDPGDWSRMAIGWRQFDNVNSDFRQAGWGYTNDGGNTWTFPGRIEPGIFRSDPVLTSDADGNFFYNSLTADGSTNFRCHVFKSIDGGMTWDSGVWAWGGDKQWQTIDRTDGIGRGNIYAAWNSFYSSCSGGFTRSYDNGQTFEACTTVAGDPHWGVLAVGPNGELYVSGTGMTLAKSSTMQDPTQPAAWDFSLTVSLDGSLAFSTGPNPAGLLGQNWIAVDHSDGPTRGNVYMLASVERSSTPDPMDVMFSRSTDGGQTWSAPVRVNDDPTTSAWQWFGTMSVAPNGRIDVVWLDTRNDATGGYQSELFYSYSTDAGVTWSPNVALTPPFDPHVGWPQQNKMGDYFDMVSDEFGANLAYAATFNNEQDVYYARIGDPACPDAGRVMLDRPKYACEGTVVASVQDCGLNTDDEVVETVVVAIDSDSETGIETMTLTETHASSALFEGPMPLSTTDGEGVLLVTEGDTVTVTYTDADDGAGGTDVPVTATAPVDCTAPLLSNVQVAEVSPITAAISFDADEPVLGSVLYGTTCDGLANRASARGYATQHQVDIDGLLDSTTYYFAAEGDDEAGNVGIEDNTGVCYSFTTPDVPDYFTEQFAFSFDLDGRKLTFSPDGSGDYYAGCVEPIWSLPTDPAGGITLGLTNDSSAAAVLSGGAAVELYGTAYTSFWVGSNGYVTFGSGDSTSSESFANHFSRPRVAALFDDLNPSVAGSISWKQLADRAVVTWQGVPETDRGGANTFQIELFFDGTISVSYLGISSSDAIAGLSDGLGLPDLFFPTNFSAFGSCGPRPPHAFADSVFTSTGTPVAVTLAAVDDGLPVDPGTLSYVIVDLPAGGYLRDPAAGSIVAAPYELAGGGDAVIYVPAVDHEGPDTFGFVANDGGVVPDGGDSNVAAVSVIQRPPNLLHEELLDADPGWATEGQWAYGEPTGGGSYQRDPISGYTGPNVYGYNLSGDYPNFLTPQALTTTPFDLTDSTGTRIEFQRWLGVEASFFDQASIEVSADGVSWTPIWTHSGDAIDDSEWTLVSYDASAVADGQPSVRFRWIMGATDQSQTHPGWNIDDIRIFQAGPGSGCQTAPGEPTELALWADLATLDWSPPADLGGAVAPVYDVLRSDSPTDFVTTAVCLEGDDGSNAWASDPALPAAGSAFYYLVRAENACGAGSWGFDSDGIERVAIDCSP
jgi:hypothetical protein